METKDWVQLGITLATFLVTAVIFYFKNLETLRKELTGSEARLRTELGGRIDALRNDVHRLDVTVARLEERTGGKSPPSAPAAAE